MVKPLVPLSSIRAPAVLSPLKNPDIKYVLSIYKKVFKKSKIV
jgi:hypothetical protein